MYYQTPIPSPHSQIRSDFDVGKVKKDTFLYPTQQTGILKQQFGP